MHPGGAPAGAAYSQTASMSFDGVDDYFGTAAGGGFPTGSSANPCSVSFWAKLNSTPGSSQTFIGSNIGGGTNKPRMSINSIGNSWMGNRIGITIDGDSYGYSSPSVNAFTVGTWAHFVVTDLGYLQASPAAIQIYKNGSVIETWEGEDYTTSNSQRFYVGGMDIYSGKFRDCNVDEVAVWRSHTLSSSEVTAIYNSGSPIDMANPGGAFTAPDSYWRMGDLDDTDGSGGVVKDRIGSYDLTAGGGNGSGAPTSDTSIP